jgi:hypothetical protein
MLEEILDDKFLLTWLMFFLPMFERTSNIKRIELVFSVPLERRCLILANKYFEHYISKACPKIIGSSLE